MENSPSKWQTILDDWRKRHEHLPWFRRYEFLLAFFVVILVYTFFLLPPYGRPDSSLGWFTILFYYALVFSFVIIILIDREKPVVLKRVFSLTVVGLFFWLFYMYSGTLWDQVQDRFFNIEKLEGVWPLYWLGLGISIRLTIISAVLALSAGLIIGTLRSLNNPVLEIFLAAYIDFFRSMPLIALMIVIFYAVPFLGINLDPFTSAVAALSLMYAAYISEIIRSGIQAIHYGQYDAAKAIGLHPVKIMTMIILPQAVRIIIPPLTSSLVGILKDTAVAYVITLPELLTRAQHATTWKLNPTPLITVSLIYLAILLPATRFTGYLETRSKRWIKKKS